MAQPINKTQEEHETDGGKLHREQMLLPLSVVGIISFIPFTIFDLWQGNYLLSGAIFAITMVFSINAYAIYRHQKIPIPFEALLIPAVISIVLSITYQGIYGSYWCYPLMLFFYFVLSRRTANLCGVLLIVAVTLIVYQMSGKAATIRFTVSLSLLIVMANIIVAKLDDLHGRLLEQNIKDPLTGAFNRRYMEARLSDAVAQKQRYHTPASLLLFDIDYFKRINDDFGHAAGDEVLKGVVKLITKRIRQCDKLFRIGGEEFLLLLPETNEEKAAILADHLCALIADAKLLEPRQVTVSIGVCELESGESLDNWMKCADQALYRAKESGRNRYLRRAAPEVVAEKETK